MSRTAPAAHPRPAPEPAVPAGPVVAVETVVCGAVTLPAPATHGATGYDICSREGLTIPPGRFAKVPTGLKLAIPEGFESQVRPRSGLAAKHGVTVLNAPGTIDSDYRGEVCVVLINHGPEPFTVEPGMRIAQMVFAPVTTMTFTTVATLAGSARGEGGFGSTGR